MGFKLNRQKLPLLLVTAVALIGLMVLAGSLSQLELGTGESFNLLALLRGRSSSPMTPPPVMVRDEEGVSLTLLMVIFWVGVAGVNYLRLCLTGISPPPVFYIGDGGTAALIG